MSAGDWILAIHVAWAAWMISGVVLAIAGLRWRRLLRWRVFRSAHLIGLLLTATVPLWAGGICPLTKLEDALRLPGSGSDAPFMVRLMAETLYLNVDPVVLSAVTGLGALITLVIFVAHPPRKKR